ncbi:MAG: DHHA1 domain-containing protein [Thiohalomonadales bacterium]
MLTDLPKTGKGNQMSENLCIYHGGCNDGFGAAYAVWKKFGDEDTEYHPGIYQEEIPEVDNRNVIIVDFSYELGKMHEIIKRAKKVTVIDHHKTAQCNIQPLINDGLIDGIFDMEKSGAVLTWEYYHTIDVPELLYYIQDRDLWKFEIPLSKEISEGLNLEKKDFKKWDALDVCTLERNGITLLRMQRKRVDETKKHAWMENIGGYDVPIVNAPYYLASDVAGELSDGHPFAAVYWESEDSKTYSLRSREGGLDVSEIAEKLGGGGHKRAAGFKVNKQAR